MHILLLIIAVLMIALLAIARTKPQKVSYRQQLRAGVRPFTVLERVSLPFVIALGILSCHVHAIGGDRLALGNALVTPGGPIDTKLADSAIGRRTLVKAGTDADHVGVCGAGDIPLGITIDNSASAAEDTVSFAQFGIYQKEVEAVANGAIAVDDMLVSGAVAGTVRKLPVVNGTYYIIGRAKNIAADGAPVAFVPCFPIQRVV